MCLDFEDLISLVILLGSHWSEYGNSQTTQGFVQSKSPTGLSVYKCTEAGINSRITVPSKVCAPRFSTKTLELFDTMKNLRARARPSFSYGPHSKWTVDYDGQSFIRLAKLHKFQSGKPTTIACNINKHAR